jgi:ComF family protein
MSLQLVNAFQSVWEAVMPWLFPDVCQVCKSNRSGKREGYVCHACRSQHGAIKPVVEPFCERCGLPFHGDIHQSFQCGNCGEMELFFRKARAAALWTPFLREIIHGYKYNFALWHEPFLAELLLDAAFPHLSGEPWDMIVPIPLHRSKQRKREFNQAERLARQLSKPSGIPTRKNILRRVEQTKTQTRLGWRQRAENVKKAFAIHPKAEIAGARIILVDDVLTTGATANACSKVLRQNGAVCVDVWTVARGVLE